MSKSRQRSQRKASNLANAAISLQSADSYDGAGRSHVDASASSGFTRPLTIRERQQLEEEQRERENRAKLIKRRRTRKRLDELERTNYRDPIISVRTGADSTSRSEDGGFSIPNAAVEEAVQRRRKQLTGSNSSLRHSLTSSSVEDGAEGGHVKANSLTRKQSAGVRRLLTYRRGFYGMLEDATSDDVFRSARYNYNTASATLENMNDVDGGVDDAVKSRHRTAWSQEPPPLHGLVYPTRPLFCTICGDWGSISCPRCGERICSRSFCLETHNDARCDRPFS